MAGKDSRRTGLQGAKVAFWERISSLIGQTGWDIAGVNEVQTGGKSGR